MNSFGCVAAVTGFFVENKKLSRPDYADRALRTGAGVDRLGSDAFELRAVNDARTSTTVDYKRGADVNRLRTDVFVLRILRCLTFEVRRDRRRDARPGRKDDMPHLEAGPGGLPLDLASTEGLGGTMPMGAAKACVLGSLPSGRR